MEAGTQGYKYVQIAELRGCIWITWVRCPLSALRFVADEIADEPVIGRFEPADAAIGNLWSESPVETECIFLFICSLVHRAMLKDPPVNSEQHA